MKKFYENYLSVQKPHYPQIIQNPASTTYRSIESDAAEKIVEQINNIGKAIWGFFQPPTHMSDEEPFAIYTMDGDHCNIRQELSDALRYAADSLI